MNAEEIVQKAKERLAEIDSEAAKLRAIIAAAEGKPVETGHPVVPAFIYPAAPQPQPWAPSIPWPLDRVTCGGILPEPDGTVYGPGPSIDNSIRYGAS